MSKIIRNCFISLTYFDASNDKVDVTLDEIQKISITPKEINAPDPDSFGREVLIGYNVKFEWTVLENTNNDIRALMDHFALARKKPGGAMISFTDPNLLDQITVGELDSIPAPTKVLGGVKPIAMPKANGDGKFDGIYCYCSKIFSESAYKEVFVATA